MNVFRIHISLFGLLIFLIGCATNPRDPALIFAEPRDDEPSATFYGEDSPGRFLRKGHEKVFVCEVNGKSVDNADFDRPVRVPVGPQKVKICYEEGLNTASAEFEAEISTGTEYQIRLGEHSWTVVNLRVEDRNTSEIFMNEQSVPKVAGETTILIFN